uniref:BspA family leucine-rich repeat surface protein n=1 Tax=Ruminococcus sp. TaxID=41978 RepID=UPI0025E18BFC
MKMKKVLAVVMSLCMTAGAVSYGAPVITQTITAQAVDMETDCYSFDEATGVLTLRGKVDRDALNEFSKNCSHLVISVVAEKGTVFPEDCRDLFGDFSECTSMDLSNADTSYVTDMSLMFIRCHSLVSLDLSNFNTSNVKNMGCMFFSCSSLTSLDLSNFDTNNVTRMDAMFYDCKSLTSLDLSSFYTRKVTDMGYVFYGCSSLTSLDLSSFDTKNIRYLDSMFENCSSLTSIDVSNFDTSNVAYMDNLFDNCTELKTISLGEKFKNIKADAKLPNGEGWINTKDTSTVISGDGDFAEIENSGKNIYKRLPIEKETYPTNIKVEYSEKYHQVRFKWDEVKHADRYGIAVYLAGKWRIQTQNITDTVYTSPKNLTTGMTYKVAIAARVNGKWDTANAIINAVTVTIGGNNSYVKPDRELRYGAELYVIADEITLYRGPDTSYGKVTTIPQKTYLQELGVMNNNNNWAFIKYNGQYGWVQMKNDKGIWEIKIMSPSPDKPVIYLYPEKETDVHVEVELTEADLATTYPKYNNGWDVVAKPDGSLVNKADGTHHRYLFWDAVNCL